MKIKKILNFILIFLLYFIYDQLIITILNKIGIDISSLNVNGKIIISILINLSLMIILYLIYIKDINKDFKDYKNNFKKYFSSNFKYYIIGLLGMIISNIIISYFISGNSTNENIIKSYINNYPIYMVFSTCIFAPFTEEIIFRKSFKNCFNSNIMYIILSGILFGFLHTISGNSLKELLFIIPYGSLGSAFAYMYCKTNNIFVPITFHLIHNSIIVFNYILLLIGG